MSYLTLHTPLGELTVFEADGAIVALEFGRAYAPAGLPPPTPCCARRRRSCRTISTAGARAFDLPLSPAGHRLPPQVWDALCRIPPGETRSYIDIAREIGCRSPRAIGQANGSNPIPILIPCHRVVAADGSLGGYSGGEGPATKRYLLALEARARPAAGTGELPLFPPSGGQRPRNLPMNHAIRVHETGGPEKLVWEEVPKPDPKTGRGADRAEGRRAELHRRLFPHRPLQGPGDAGDRSAWKAPAWSRRWARA